MHWRHQTDEQQGKGDLHDVSRLTCYRPTVLLRNTAACTPQSGGASGLKAA
jgi:hypothetical protein